MNRYVVDYDEYKQLKHIKEHSYEIFKEHCVHGGYYKWNEDEEKRIKMCGLMDQKGNTAKSWSDWKECCPENCPIFKQIGGM